MSGVYTRSPYDECYFKQYNSLNKSQFEYHMFLNTYINSCPHQDSSDNCPLCNHNKEAQLTDMPNDFVQKITIDSSMKGIDRILHYCDDDQSALCNIKQAPRTVAENNMVPNIPYLCDRLINPTNMKMEN